MPVARVRPSVFVGSSSEGLRIAQAIQVLLDQICEVEIWSQGVFGLTHGTLESLVLALERFDFAVLVLTADDLTISRGTGKAGQACLFAIKCEIVIEPLRGKKTPCSFFWSLLSRHQSWKPRADDFSRRF